MPKLTYSFFLFWFLCLHFTESILLAELNLPIALGATEGGAIQSLWANPALFNGVNQSELMLFGGTDLGLSPATTFMGGAMAVSPNPFASLSAGYFLGDNIQRYRTLLYATGSQNSSASSSTQYVPVNVSSRLFLPLSMGMTVNYKMGGNISIESMALGFILEKKKGPKLGLYWPSLKPDAVSFSTLVIGAAYTTDEFSMNLDYLQADAASGMSSRVAFGAGMTTLSSLHASFSWIFPLQSSNSQNFLSAMQISTFIKLFLGSSFFIHVQLSNNGLLLGGLGLSF